MSKLLERYVPLLCARWIRGRALTNFLALLAAAIIALNASESSVWGWQVEPHDQITVTEQAIKKSTEFLISKQNEDGAWHSEHYGSMKQGAANTSLVLYALTQLPPEQLQAHSDALRRAGKFLLAGIEKKGCAANPDGSLDYPVYGTALVLTAHSRFDLGLSAAQVERMVKFLVDSQCLEARGFTDQNPNHGGWDILGPKATRGKTAGANVSVTFFAVEALGHFRQPAAESKPIQSPAEQTASNPLSSELQQKVKSALDAAAHWCQQVQSSDGGFYFTSERESTLNKASWKDKLQTTPNSYGSATCDGLSLLLQLRPNQYKKPIRASIKWLADRPGVETVPGFKADVDQTGWPSSLRFYYIASLSRSLDALESDLATATKNAIQKQLIDSQLQSGCWKNESSYMRENDELIATPFGLIALLNCKSIEAKQRNKNQ